MTVTDEKRVHVCDGCGNWTDEPCTDEEAVKEFGMLYEPDFEGEGPAWFCEACI